MNSLRENIKPYSKAIVKLLKGTVESKDNVWKDIILYQIEIQNYLSQIGLELIVKENDGYAFVKQFEIDDDGNTIGIASKRQLGFETSVILIILRQLIEEFENNPTEAVSEKYITHEELVNEIELFLNEKYNKVQFFKDIDKYIKRIVELGYLKEVKGDTTEQRYKIHKIITEKITLDILNEFNEKLKKYVESI